MKIVKTIIWENIGTHQQIHTPVWETETKSLSQMASSCFPSCSTAFFMDLKGRRGSSETSWKAWRWSSSQRWWSEGHSCEERSSIIQKQVQSSPGRDVITIPAENRHRCLSVPDDPVQSPFSLFPPSSAPVCAMTAGPELLLRPLELQSAASLTGNVFACSQWHQPRHFHSSRPFVLPPPVLHASLNFHFFYHTWE